MNVDDFNLLDKNRRILLSEKNLENLDHVNFYDEKCNIIGKINFPSKTEIVITQSDDRPIFSLVKTGLIQKNYELRDLKGNLKGIFNLKKSGKLDSRNINFKDEKGFEILTGTILRNWLLEIRDRSEKKIATFGTLAQSFISVKPNFDLHNSYVFVVLDSSYNKKFLVGCFVVLLQELKDGFFDDRWSHE